MYEKSTRCVYVDPNWTMYYWPFDGYMTHFNEVVEEEKARFIGTWLPNGKESEQSQMEADFDQAMHKTALAVVEEVTDLAWEYIVEATRADSWSKKELQQHLEPLREQLTDKE